MQKLKLQFKIENVLAPFAIIIFAVILRLLPHPPNIAPIAAMALFGGVYLNKKYALIVPLIAMVISDYFLGFHTSMLFVYTSFLISGFIGLWLRTHKTFRNIFFGTILSSILFFLLTNFNFWYVNAIYPKTFNGLLQSYIMALPFFRNTILGDLLYVGLFFGSYEFIVLLTHQQIVSKRFR